MGFPFAKMTTSTRTKREERRARILDAYAKRRAKPKRKKNPNRGPAALTPVDYRTRRLENHK